MSQPVRETDAAGNPRVTVPVSEFKVGQTVWHKYSKLLGGKIVWLSGEQLWIKGLGYGESFIAPAADFTATDPNQPVEPVPQACPFCGMASAKCFMHQPNHWVSCTTDTCRLSTPYKPTRLEAIQAWNAIRVEKIGVAMVPAGERELRYAPAPEPTPKPCPVCGTHAVFHADDSNVQCESEVCYMSGPTGLNRSAAILAWNKLGDVAAEREECAKIVEHGHQLGVECPILGQGPLVVKFLAFLADRIRSRGQQ